MTIQYRNYNFSFYRKKDETNYKLGFYRIKNKSEKNDVMTSANCAYLQLPGKETGGTTPTNEWDNFISYNKADAMAKAQIFNTFVVDYPDWNDNDVTGIKEIDDNKTTEPNLHANSIIYDIAGREVTTYGAIANGYVRLPKGIYILNGKKVIIR